MVTYSDLLLDPRWKRKRNEILERDHFECVQCRNEWLSSFQTVYIIDSTIQQHKNGYCLNGYSVTPFHLLSGISCFSLYHWDQSFPLVTKCNNINVIAVKVIPLEIIERQDFLKLLHRGNYKDIKNLENQFLGIPFKIVYSLHVHHQFYQRSLLPWKYENEALITLCWNCHEQLHRNGHVPIFNNRLIQIGEYNYCTRCLGAGWFPEFSPIQDGICSRCQGAKYEELIEPQSLK